MLRFEGLEQQHPGGPRLRFADAALARGETALLLGPSGSGKSTLLQLAAGLLAPTRGEVWLDGQPLSALAESARDRLRGARVGLVFQRLHLIPALDVAGNLALARRLAGRPADPARIRQLLAALGIEALAGRRPHQLSLGQAQRVAIARALVHAPGLILADEPTAALDDAAAEAVARLLLEQASAQGAALLIVTHDARLRPWVARHWQLPAVAA